jgi:hypothetical protein
VGVQEPWQIEWERKERERRLDMPTRVRQELTPDNKKRPPNRQAVGATQASFNTVEALVEYLRTPKKKRDLDMLDNIILNNVLDDVPIRDISNLVGLPVSEVQNRSKTLLKENYTFSQEEMKLLMTAKLQRISNMMMSMASQGSDKHAGVMLECIKQMREMYDLMSSKSNITIEIVTVEQTNIIVTAMGLFAERLMAHPALSKIDRNVIDSVAADALGEAAEYVFEARDREVTIDAKGSRVA